MKTNGATTEQKLLSIIVPIYNVEKWLPDCLDSLLSQNIPLEAYEIICVNDGSSDDSLGVLCRYAQKYSNITIINKSNGGVSTARNAGIDAAKGKYLWFVDSDDKIRVNILKDIFENVNEEDMICLGYQNIREEDIGLKRTPDDFEYISDLNITDDAGYSKYDHMDYFVRNSVVLALIKRSMILRYGLRFDIDLHYSEDWHFKSLVESRSKRIGLADTVAYYYRQRNDSAIHNDSPEAKRRYCHAWVRAAVLYKQQIEEHGNEMNDYYNSFFKTKMLLSAESAVLSHAFLDKKTFNSTIAEMKTLGIYPYDFIKSNLDLKQYASIKQKLLSLFKYPFPLEWYAKAAAFFCRHLPGKRNQSGRVDKR